MEVAIGKLGQDYTEHTIGRNRYMERCAGRMTAHAMERNLQKMAMVDLHKKAREDTDGASQSNQYVAYLQKKKIRKHPSQGELPMRST